jgi:hypothetical protein
MTPWLRYLIAFAVFCHGFRYVRIGSALPSPIEVWRRSSWLLRSAVTDGQLKTLVMGLYVFAGLATLACAVSIGFAPSFPGWWRPLAIGGAAMGIAAFAVFWDGQAQFLFEEGLIGAVVSLILLLSAVAFPRAFGG